MTPTLEELLASARVVDLPLRAPFRGLTRREALLFEGPSGWAEWAPFRDHSDAHSARWLLAAIEQAYGSWPEPVRESVPVNAILPDLGAAASANWAAEQFAAGLRTFKLKVGHEARVDAARVAAVREAVGSGAALRVDANGRWTQDEAVEVLPRLLRAAGELEYVEQPCASLRDCAAVRRALPVRIAVDEGVRLAGDPAAVADALLAAADVIVLKSIPLGGVRDALELAEVVGLPVVVSGSLDTSVGIASGVALASALPELDFACGLGTGALFDADVVSEPVLPIRGELRPSRVVPEPELLERYASSAEVAGEWQARLARCHALLERDERESL